jgi:hypothetical protein
VKPYSPEVQSVIDWIEFEIHVHRLSNFWTVQKTVETALGVKEYVDAIDAGGGNAASKFSMRLQNPTKAAILDLVESLRQRYGNVTIQPTAVEIAHDTYSNGAGVQQLAGIVADRFRFLTSPPGDAWYFYRKKNEGNVFLDTLPQRRDLIDHFEKFWQLTDRHNEQCDVRYHAYVKTRDGGQDLSPDKWRARLEVTLRGDALPFTTLDELLVFDFAKLARYFKYRRLANDLHPSAEVALSTWSGRQIGESGKYRRRIARTIGKYSGVSVFRRWTVADDTTNAQVYECLRGLSRGWKGSRSGADFPEHL